MYHYYFDTKNNVLHVYNKGIGNDDFTTQNLLMVIFLNQNITAPKFWPSLLYM